MTAKLKIRREKILSSEGVFPIMTIGEIENFTLVLFENPEGTELYQGKIFDTNSSLVLISPQLDFDRCLKKIHMMLQSLGEIVNVETSSPEIDLKPLLLEYKMAFDK